MTDTFAKAIDPREFVAPGRRLFIDTNVFMDTNPKREGALRRLFERCADDILTHGNPVIIASKVKDELERQSRINPSELDSERQASVRKAANALVFLADAAVNGLVRTDLGDVTNPYADDLFVELFTLVGGRFEPCLITNDITLRLRLRLIAAQKDQNIVAGVLTREGLVEVDSPQALYERASRKLKARLRRVESGTGDRKDESEATTLAQLLPAFQEAFHLAPSPTGPQAHHVDIPHRVRPTRKAEAAGAFLRTNALRAPDVVLEEGLHPGEGDYVLASSPSGSVSTLRLGPEIGQGGEGRVFAVAGEAGTVVKIFDREHRTQHRLEKLTLLLTHDLQFEGISFPTSLISDTAGNFAGYAMPQASGKELQATVMRPARFKRTYPNWTKADLVDVCISFLEKVAYLHSLNIILGDINPKNVMVDADKTVWIIDADSWQLEGYPCPVGTPMFTAASVTGDYANALRTEQEELFAVATMLFMILITGQFPYARTGVDGGDFAQLIHEGKFAFQFQGVSDRDQPEGSWKYMWSHLPIAVKRMFWHTFHRDGDRYTNRPTADEWLQTFRGYRDFFGSSEDFDPMSSEVYPTRFKMMARDTPEYPCRRCGTSVIGRWNDAKQEYWTPAFCDDCGRNLPRCAGCQKPKPPEALQDGRCRECNRATCEKCGTITARRSLVDGRCRRCAPIPCKTCGTPTQKADLSRGRCSNCAQLGDSLDPNRMCEDCRQPFITFDHDEWFKARALELPKRHASINKTCPPRTAPAAPITKPQIPTTSQTRTEPKKSWWQRLWDNINA